MRSPDSLMQGKSVGFGFGCESDKASSSVSAVMLAYAKREVFSYGF